MKRLPATALALLLASTPAMATPFAYHSYESMLGELADLAAAHPELTELFTAQDRWGLDPVPDGSDLLVHPILRITDESSGLDKPELLIVGAQHGNEVVGVEVCLVLARLLLESYGVDPWLSDLVKRREIYLLPLANPHGFRHDSRWSPGTEGPFENMNRDHLYEREIPPCPLGCEDEVALSTVGGRAIHELARRHLFRVMLDLHGGIEMIVHSWGTPLHDPPHTESPDDVALDRLGRRMSEYGGPYSGLYPVGRSNVILYSVYGPLDDTAYATSWDPGNSDPTWPTQGWRALAYTVEISDIKRPPVSTLGGDAELLVPGGAEDGYVPKNVRGALVAVDLAEPWIVWSNRSSLPPVVAAGELMTVSWMVRGCLEVDETRVRWGTDPEPLASWQGQTAAQAQTTGSPCFGSPTEFSTELSIAVPGSYWITPVARVDSALLQQTSPSPGLTPQSWIVRARTEDGVLEINDTDPTEVNTVQGRIYFGAEPLPIVVGSAELFADGFETGTLELWDAVQP